MQTHPPLICPSNVSASSIPHGNIARPKHIPALDGIRGLAVLLVFVFHYGGGTHSSLRAMQLFGHLNKGGWSGVILFFVLSGFLITGILWDSYADPHWWRKFFARRSLRIFPLYFLVLILVVLAAIPFGDVRAVLAHIWIPALFLENFPSLARISDTLPSPLATFHLWSIAVEEQFYLLWPFLLFWQKTRERAKLLCLITILVSFFFRILIWSLHPEPGVYEHFLLTQAGALAAGGWLALAYRGPEWPRVLRLAPFLALVGLVGYAASGLLSHSFETLGRYMMTWGLPSITLLFAAMLALALEPGLISRLFSLSWLRWLGNISFGVYIFHMLFIKVIVHITNAVASGRSQTAHLLVQFILAATLSLVAALLSFHLYEKQFLRLKKRFAPQTRITPAKYS